MPTGVPIQITFNRANASKSLLQVKAKDGEKDLTYEDRTVPILSPTLAVYFVESVKADSFYGKARLYDISVPFFDYNIRRELLLDSVSEHKIKVFEGPLPCAMMIGLMDPNVFDGDVNCSTFKFARHGLDSIDIRVDNLSMVNYPIAMKNGNSIDFYLNYLKMTNRFDNVYTNGALKYSNFVNSNFLVFVDFKREQLTHGQVVIKLKFDTLLAKKLFLIFMPIYEKAVTFDSYLNPSVNTVH